MMLYKSRGYETSSHKAFMRGTVLFMDLALLFPVIWYALKVFYKDLPSKERLVLFVAMAAHPGLLIVDHGHFQYNNVSLGLALLALALVADHHELLGSAAFVLSLCYKQMSLYYAPAFFFFLLAKATNHKNIISLHSVMSLAKIGVVVIATFIACLLPFLLQEQPLAQLQQLATRVFPVARGLYEDKVANFWCSISPVFKLQNFAPQNVVVQVCLIFTLLGMAPASLALLRAFQAKPKNSADLSAPFGPASTFLVGLCCIAFSFFFFSYHVHEKSVLLPVFMLSLWFHQSPSVVAIANVVSTLSMLPLLQRDGHEYSLLIATLAYAILLVVSKEGVNKWMLCAAALPPLACHLLGKIIPPPASLPDIWVLLLTASSFAVLGLCWLALHTQLFLLDRLSPMLWSPSSKKHEKDE